MGGRGSASAAGRSGASAGSANSAANIPTFNVPERWGDDGKFRDKEFTERLNGLIGRFNRAKNTSTRTNVIASLDAHEKAISASMNANDRIDDRGYLRTALRQTRQTRQRMMDYLKRTL